MEFLRVERMGAIAELVLAQPPVNALHTGMVREPALQRIAASPPGDDALVPLRRACAFERVTLNRVSPSRH